MDILHRRVLAGLLRNERAAEHFVFKDYDTRIFYDINKNTSNPHIHGYEESGKLAAWSKTYYQKHAELMPWSFVVKMVKANGQDDLPSYKAAWREVKKQAELPLGEWKEQLDSLIHKYREYRHKNIYLTLGEFYAKECLGKYEPGDKCKNCRCGEECRRFKKSDETDRSQYLLNWSASQTEQIKLDTQGTYIRAYEVGKLMMDCMSTLDKERKLVDENGNRIITGFPTPFPSLTEHIGGWMLGRLYGFGSRSGVGKSAALLQCGNTVAQSNIPVIHFNLEMPVREELGFRIVSYFSGISFSDIMKRRIDDATMAKLTKAVKNWIDELRTNKNYRIVDIPRRTSLATIMRYTDNFMAEKGTNRILLILDYFNLLYIDPTSKRADLEWALLAEELHSFARDRELACLTALQLNRLGDKTRKVTPKHFRDSDKIIDNFDGCWALLKYTENYAKMAHVKGRYFQPKDFALALDLDKMRFSEYSKTPGEEAEEETEEAEENENGDSL